MDERVFSKCLSNYLDIVIGEEALIATRRRLYNMTNSYQNLKHHHTKGVLAGSRVDGFDLPESDLDVMFVTPLYRALDIEEMCIQPANTILLKMRYSAISPGSVLLSDIHGRPAVLSSCLVKDEFASVMLGSIVDETIGSLTQHGPSLTLSVVNNGQHLSTDSVPAFPCLTWPNIAREWRYRKRPHGWPRKSLIEQIINSGCHVVPVGDGLTAFSDNQWRISFVTAESKLVQSLNQIQFKTYGLLKIFLNDSLKVYKEGNDSLLCSYYMKTIIFYAVENSPSNFWIDENITNCFRFCFNMLIECIEKGYLPNYFIPGNNMFRKRIHGMNRLLLLNVLYKYRHKRIDCVLYSCKSMKLLQEFVDQRLQYELFTTLASDRIESGIEARIDCAVGFYLSDSIDAILHTTNDPEFHEMMKCKTLMLLAYTENEIDLYTASIVLRLILIREANFQLRKLRKDTVRLNNRMTYAKRRTCVRYLLFVANLDVSLGWLTLSSVFYLMGQYDKALEICLRVKASISPMNGILYHNLELKPGVYERKMCGRGLSLHRKLKQSLAVWHRLTPYDVDIFPKEIELEVLNYKLHNLYVPSLSYASFLAFMCLCMLEDKKGSQAALSDLEACTVFDTEFIVSWDRYILSNLLGICYEKSGDIANARSAYLKSLDLNPDGKAAHDRLQELCEFG